LEFARGPRSPGATNATAAQPDIHLREQLDGVVNSLSRGASEEEEGLNGVRYLSFDFLLIGHTTSGHVWQGRFYSCPMDESHLWIAPRYTELNPVRARMVEEATAWPWSSTGAHCGMPEPNLFLDMAPWRRRWSEMSWRKFLEVGEGEEPWFSARQDLI